jgi:hypothetical protein
VISPRRIVKVMRQLPETEMLQVPARSPASRCAPTGRCAQALDVRSGDEKGQHVADALHEVAAQFA